MSKGFLWFAQNNLTTDYVELSISLAKSIKRWNKNNKVCVITDEKSKFTSEHVDVVKVLAQDEDLWPHAIHPHHKTRGGHVMDHEHRLVVVPPMAT